MLRTPQGQELDLGKGLLTMWGKHYRSMYDGSMYGSGLAVFAVWGWVISNMKDGVVEINVQKLADTLGGKADEIKQAITFLCSPDPQSRFKAHDGRRMIKEGEFQYLVPSWEYYQQLKNEEARREYNRQAQRKFRESERQRKAFEAAKAKEIAKREKKNLSEAARAGRIAGGTQVVKENFPVIHKESPQETQKGIQP